DLYLCIQIRIFCIMCCIFEQLATYAVALVVFIDDDTVDIYIMADKNPAVSSDHIPFFLHQVRRLLVLAVDITEQAFLFDDENILPHFRNLLQLTQTELTKCFHKQQIMTPLIKCEYIYSLTYFRQLFGFFK